MAAIKEYTVDEIRVEWQKMLQALTPTWRPKDFFSFFHLLLRLMLLCFSQQQKTLHKKKTLKN